MSFLASTLGLASPESMVESIQAEKVKSASTERTQFTLSRGFRTTFQQETSKRIQELNNALLISLLPTTYHLIPFSCPKCLGMCTYIGLTSTLFLHPDSPGRRMNLLGASKTHFISLSVCTVPNVLWKGLGTQSFRP